MKRVPTVTIKGGDGKALIINEADYDAETHELFEAVAEEPAPEPKNAELIHKGGGRWVVEVDGEPVHEGTLSKAEAQTLVAEQ